MWTNYFAATRVVDGWMLAGRLMSNTTATHTGSTTILLLSWCCRL
jgi:hypothetical protein